MYRQWLLGITVAAGWAAGQTLVDLGKQSTDVDFSQAASTRPLKSGATLPSTCAVGQMFYLTSAAAGANLYGCTAVNTWTPEGSGGGSVQSASQLTDLRPSRTSSTVLTVGQNCSASAPCNVAVNGATYAFTGPMTITNAATAPLTARGYVSDGNDGQSAGTFVVANSATSGLTCSGACTVLNSVSAFPVSAGVVTEFAWTATGTNGQWDVTGYTDWRPFQGGGARIFSTNGNCVVSPSSGGTGIACSGGAWSDLHSPTSATSLNMGTYATAFTWNDPNLGDPNFHYGMQFTDSVDANSTLNNNFSAEAMFSHNYLFNWGQALYGSGTNAKRTASINNDSMTSSGSGQSIMNNAILNCWGMSDCARDSTTITYGGGNVAGDEARGFTVVSRLQQLGNLVKTTLSSGAARSGCPANMTLTQSVTANVTPQTVTVSSSTGCQIGDWLVADWNGATGYPNWDAVQITGVGTGTITGHFTANHASGATVKAGVVLTVSSTFEFGQDRVLVDLSGSSYTTGTATAANTSMTGSGTSWSNSMVGGEAISPGCFAFTGDDQTYSPFGSGANALRSWWEINPNSVTSATTLSIFSFSVPGAGFYSGVGSGAFVIRPCARIVFMSGNTVVLSPNNFTWTNGDSIEEALTPYPDVQGFNYFVSGYTPAGIYRGFMNIANNGGQQHGNVFTIQNIMVGNTSSSSPSAFHAFLADAGSNGSNPMLDYILDFGNTTLKSGSMRLPSPFNSATNGDITWNQTGATVGTARDGSTVTGLELCGLGGGGGARPDGCFYSDLRNSHPLARMQSHGLEIDASSDDVQFALNKTNDDLFIHTTTGGHILSGGQYMNHGFMAEIGINGTETPYYVLGTNTSGTPGFFALPEAAAVSGTNHRSIRLGVAASVWNGAAESPVWAFWDLEPDSNSNNATTHAYLYGPCASPITNNCQYLAAGLDGLAVTGPAAADYWTSTLGTAIASAATIAPAKYITHVTGTTAIATITPPAGCSATGKSCLLVLVPDAANVYNTSGNIANALTATVNVPVMAVYDNAAGKWYLK